MTRVSDSRAVTPPLRNPKELQGALLRLDTPRLRFAQHPAEDRALKGSAFTPPATCEAAASSRGGVEKKRYLSRRPGTRFEHTSGRSKDPKNDRTRPQRHPNRNADWTKPSYLSAGSQLRRPPAACVRSSPLGTRPSVRGRRPSYSLIFGN